MIPIKGVSSVTTEKDGLRNTKVKVITSGNTIDFRVGHGDAEQIKQLLTSLVLGTHPEQQSGVSGQSGLVMTSGTPPTQPLDIADQIKKLAELKDAGVLSLEEFDAKKSELLGRL